MAKSKKRIETRRPEIRLTGGQFKSLAAGRAVAEGIGLIEAYWGIESCLLKVVDPFICPDVDWRALDRTPNERILREALLEIQQKRAAFDR